MESGKSETGGPGKSETGNPKHDAPLAFSGWAGALASMDWSEDVKKRRQLAIMRLLKFCKLERRPVSVTLIKSYLENLERQGNLWPETREALRWFVIEARKRSLAVGVEAVKTPAVSSLGFKQSGGGPGSLPASGASDLGGAEWERCLVTALRRQGKMWRTEQTYRGWAWRFADFIRPSSPEQAGEDEVRAFLTDLAVRQRVGQNTQKQALNA